MLTLEEKKARAEARKAAKRIEKANLKIEAEKNQKPVKRIEITIEWKRSKIWGSNPHAEARVSFHDGTFEYSDGYTASGCGYDKQSTVVAEIFNKYLKYKLWNKTIEECKRNDRDWKGSKQAPYGIWADIYEGIESRGFSGGIGTSCYVAISEFIGGQFKTIASGKSFDVFEYSE